MRGDYGVLTKPRAGQSLKSGFDQLARLLSLTLGPTQGVILSHKPETTTLELLDDAATIARRMMALPDRGEDVGAMLLRHLVWRMHTRVGDGCATTAVLAQALLEGATRATAAGANPMLLRRGIERATASAVNALAAQAQPVTNEEILAHVAEAITAEPNLAQILGEIFDLLGPEGHVEIQDFVAPYLEREYLEGGRWDGRLASTHLVTNPRTQRAVLTDCAVVLLDGELSEVGELGPLLEMLLRLEQKQLTLIAREIKGQALTTLVINHQRELLKVAAVELRTPGAQALPDFEDLAALTGATLLGDMTGRSLRSLKTADLGTARRVEATMEALIVVGAPAHGETLRRQIERLRTRQAALPPEEEETRSQLRSRLGRLTGRNAVLKIGAYTKPERDLQRSKAEKALRAIPLALQKGVVPGGGVAYLNCISAVRALEVASEDEAWGREVVAKALEAPFRCIIRNAGRKDEGALLVEAQRRGPSYGYHVLRDEIVEMATAGVLDAADVLRAALETAVSGAVMALTTEVTVLHKKPRQSMEP